ncbi:MAG: putative secreted protein [Alphaproteobacteria bacterium]|nr:putative secreted protein [Alphaproteobacteria bacterium]
MKSVHLSVFALAAIAVATLSAPAAMADPPKPRADPADVAQGTYFGDVISDARGSPRSDVRITVTKIGPNRVRISSDYSRVPDFSVTLSQTMNTILNNGTGNEVFLLDLSKTPPALDVTVDDASWSGRKE